MPEYIGEGPVQLAGIEDEALGDSFAVTGRLSTPATTTRLTH